MSETRRIQVKSMVNYKVGLFIPDMHFEREFTREGETKSIDFEILYESINSLGVRTLFEEGILHIENRQDRIDLGLEEADAPETVKVLNNGQILKLLRVDSLEKFTETIKNLPLEQVKKIADVAINNKVTDFDKCALLKKRTKIDVIANIQNDGNFD